MLRWISRCTWLLPVIILLMGITGNVQARDTIKLTGSDGKDTEFPYYVRNISSKIAQYIKQGKEVKRLESYPSCVLKELQKACEVLPQAARNRYAKKVGQDKINGQTIFVNKNTTQLLKDNGLIPGRNDHNMAMLFQLFNASVEYDLGPLRRAYAFEIAKRIEASDEIAHLKNDKYFKKMSSENIFHQAVEQLLTSYQDTFSKHRDELSKVDCLKNQQWIEVYVALLLKGIKTEFTVADYIGLHGQSNWKNGHINLSNQGLTSIEGLRFVAKPGKIKTIDLSRNDIQTPRLIRTFIAKGEEKVVDMAAKQFRAEFAEFKNLEQLNLSTNQLTYLPDTIFVVKCSVDEAISENTSIPALSESFCHITRMSLKNNPIPYEMIRAIVGLFPLGTIERDQCIGAKQE